MSENKSNVLRNTSIVFMCAFVAKLLSLVRESIIAAYAGTSMEADAYYMVMSIYSICELGLSTSIYQGFFPVYKETAIRDKAESHRFANTAIVVLTLASLVLVFFEIVLSKYILMILAPGFSSEGIQLSQKLLILSSFVLIPIVLAECFSAILRSNNLFFWSQIRELATHIAAIAIIFVLYDSFGIYAMVLGMLGGGIFRAIIQLPAFRRVHNFKSGINLKSKEIKNLLSRIPSILVTATVTEIKNVVDKMMASSLATGAVSTLNYGYRIESAISGIVFNSIATGLYPEMVQLYVENKLKKLAQLIEKCTYLILALIVPLEVATVFYGEDVIRLIYMRGSFGETEVVSTNMVFIAYMMGAVFFGLSLILNNTYYAAGNTTTPMKINIVDLILNIIFNMIFVRYFDVAGLAAATSLAALITFFLRYIFVNKYVCLNTKRIALEFGKICIASFVACLLSLLMVNVLNVQSSLFKLIIAIIVAVPIYFLTLFITKTQSFGLMIGFLKEKHRA